MFIEYYNTGLVAYQLAQVLETQERALTERITSLGNESQLNSLDPNHVKELQKKVHQTRKGLLYTLPVSISTFDNRL